MHVSRIILCINAQLLPLSCSKQVGTLTCSRRTQELAISAMQQLYDINMLIVYNKQHTFSYKSMKLLPLSCSEHSGTLPAASVHTLFQESGTNVTLLIMPIALDTVHTCV